MNFFTKIENNELLKKLFLLIVSLVLTVCIYIEPSVSKLCIF